MSLRDVEEDCPWWDGEDDWHRDDDVNDDEEEGDASPTEQQGRCELEYEKLTTRHVRQWVQWRTAEEECSYMELVSDGPQKPQYALNLSETQSLFRAVCVGEFASKVSKSFFSFFFHFFFIKLIMPCHDKV